MGMSGAIIKKKGEKTVGEVLKDLRTAAWKAGLEFREHRDGIFKDSCGRLCAICWIANYFTEEEVSGQAVLLVELSSAEEGCYKIDDVEVYDAIIFDRIAFRGEILLELLYEYFKLNPNDYFEGDELYTNKDIATLRSREFDENWYHKKLSQIPNIEVNKDSVCGRTTAGQIIKQSKEKTIYEIIYDLEMAAGKAHLKIKVEPELYQNEKNRVMFGVAHIAEDVSKEGVQGDELLLYILFGTDVYHGNFEWIEENRNLFRAIVFHKISGREIMLLDFLDEYFKLNPNDYFVDAYTLHEGNKWYYTPEDIKNIKETELDDAWCYKKPYLGERSEKEAETRKRRAGIPAFLLKRNGEKTIHEIMKSVQVAAEQAGLEFWIGMKPDAGQKPESADAYGVCNIEGCSDNEYWGGHQGQLQLHIRSTEQERHRYDWIQDGGDLIHAVTFTCISDNEEILLIFLNEYFKIYPEDYFVVGDTSLSEDFRWYYTREDITQRISKLDDLVQEILQCKMDDPDNHNVPTRIMFNDMWCYTDPHTKLRIWSYDYKEPISFEND